MSEEQQQLWLCEADDVTRVLPYASPNLCGNIAEFSVEVRFFNSDTGRFADWRPSAYRVLCRAHRDRFAQFLFEEGEREYRFTSLKMKLA